MFFLLQFDFLAQPVKAAVFNPAKAPGSHIPRLLQQFKNLGLNTIFVEAQQQDFDVTAHALTVQWCRQLALKIVYRPGPFVSTFLPLGGVSGALFEGRAIQRRFDNPEFAQNAQDFIAHISAFLVENRDDIAAVQLDKNYFAQPGQAGFYEYLRMLYVRNGVYGPFIVQEDTEVEGLMGVSYIVSDASLCGESCFVGDILTGSQGTVVRKSSKTAYFNVIQDLIKSNSSFVLYGVYTGVNFKLDKQIQSPQINDFSQLIFANNKLSEDYFNLQEILGGLNSEESGEFDLQNFSSYLVNFGALRYQEFIKKGTFYNAISSESVDLKQNINKYTFRIEKNVLATLKVSQVNKNAQLYVNDTYLASFNKEIEITISSEDGIIQIVTFPAGYDNQPNSGMTGKIEFNSQEVHHITLETLDMFNYTLKESKADFWSGDGVYSSKISLQKKGFYVNLFGVKGYFLINGVMIGFSDGDKLYCPEDFVLEGVNEIIVIALENQFTLSIALLSELI
ncbi:Beta-galactosidase [Spironucleus salmonicida]|uniref:Beta-galactosidase n=1 Tax=Spironucleus salmonicida TaxID=348837 RepID=V6LJA7_9EUKA|nr:Beta-galactosidase [Spironucleus salmonicida]|eukprot:EST44448.1 Beta-galactosidase [Spironucleus salmonicida]